MNIAAIDPRLRRSYDLRGVVGDSLSEADAYGVGRRFAAVAGSEGACRVAVSRDGRTSSPTLESALVDGLVEGGMRVYRLPAGPTPLVSFAIDRLGLDGGVMVTGSHNPPDQNGFKFHLGRDPFYGAALKRLWVVEPSAREGGSIEEVDLAGFYLDALAAELDGVTVAAAAWDSGNGATGPIVERLAARIGDQRTLFTTMDGTFPNHHPDPSVVANLQLLRAAVSMERLDLGIAFDGDGDRIGLVDAAGEIVWADQLILLLARDTLRERPGSAIVADVKSSGVLFDGIAAAGGRPVMAPSGYVLIRERMLAERAPLAGEMSGHIFFGDRWHDADDGLYVAVRTLRALAASGRSLRDFRESLPVTFATPEVRFACPDDRKAAVLAAIAGWAEREGRAIDRTDGLRVAETGGWWLLRASGTETKLTARCEGESADALGAIRRRLAKALRREGLDPAGLD
jgi:phosphomannomutase